MKPGGTAVAIAPTMTKREWDKATKFNYGAREASDTRRTYRWMRMTDRLWSVKDMLAARAEFHAWRNAKDGIGQVRDGFLPLLAIGSKWRTVAAHRARTGRPMLGVSA